MLEDPAFDSIFKCLDPHCDSLGPSANNRYENDFFVTLRKNEELFSKILTFSVTKISNDQI